MSTFLEDIVRQINDINPSFVTPPRGNASEGAQLVGKANDTFKRLYGLRCRIEKKVRQAAVTSLMSITAQFNEALQDDRELPGAEELDDPSEKEMEKLMDIYTIVEITMWRSLKDQFPNLGEKGLQGEAMGVSSDWDVFTYTPPHSFPFDFFC